MKLPERVLRTVRKHGLIPEGGRVVVALSGGPDSVALVHLLRDLESAGGFSVAGLAHFNHQLRGADADADEAFCRATAVSLGLPIDVGRADVRSLARQQGRSVEDAAREVRYAFLEQAADRLGGDVIAVGHSLDDQAETFLLRLVRGAGPRGLAGIHPRAGRVVRPLLDLRRPELREYATARGLEWRDDATNTDVSIPRNRVRHELLPYLERHFSPGIVEVLAREASIARMDEAHLEREAIDLASSIVLGSVEGKPVGSGPVKVDAGALASLDAALASRVARLALAAAAPGRFFGFDHIERVLDFARDASPGAALSLPGIQAAREVGRVVLAAVSHRSPAQELNSFRYPLSIPGEVTLDTQGWVVTAARGPDGEPGTAGPSVSAAPWIRVQAGRVQMPLAVRSWQPGDRFRPLGMGGRRKKLQDLFVDRKIPRKMRGTIPLVVDGGDRIVWVVGEAVAEDFRVTEPSQGVIFLKARRLGGLG